MFLCICSPRKFPGHEREGNLANLSEERIALCFRLFRLERREVSVLSRPAEERVLWSCWSSFGNYKACKAGFPVSL